MSQVCTGTAAPSRAAFRRPPWVRDSEVLIGPRMEDSRLWKEIVGKLRNPFPVRLILLTATPYGVARGAPGNGRPYRNQKRPFDAASSRPNAALHKALRQAVFKILSARPLPTCVKRLALFARLALYPGILARTSGELDHGIPSALGWH